MWVFVGVWVGLCLPVISSYLIFLQATLYDNPCWQFIIVIVGALLFRRGKLPTKQSEEFQHL